MLREHARYAGEAIDRVLEAATNGGDIVPIGHPNRPAIMYSTLLQRFEMAGV